ncbi:unnamed protein product [Rotaria socialis]
MTEAMYETHHHPQSNENEDNGLIKERILEDDISPRNSRAAIHWRPDLEGDIKVKQPINTDTEHFDALFARSNASPLPASHPRCYSSCSPSTVPFQMFTDSLPHDYAKSQPHLTLSSHSVKPYDDRRNSTISSTKSQHSNSTTSSNSAQTKRKTFFLTHAAQTLLQTSNSQAEQLEPLARSCSYKRPQSIKKYRQQKKGKEKGKEKEKEQKEQFSCRKHSTYNNNNLHTVAFYSARKSITGVPARISATDLMATDDPNEQWSSPKARRSARIGSLPLDQLQIPHDGDEEIYLVRQFNTTSKGFVNRGDSFKRSFKRSGSISRRGSFRKTDRTPSQEQINDSLVLNNEIRSSTNSLTNTKTTPCGPNLNGILDNQFNDSAIENISSSPITNNDDHDDDDDDDNEIVERIETEDGHVQDIRVYQVYLLGMSGTGKCSLLRQFKTTEYRGIYDYSSSIEDDPDNTVSIMLDGVESRLHIINIDVDHIKSSVTGDAYLVVYSITDRQSFQTAVQLIKNVREKESTHNETSLKRYIPIILVGNKSDLVRKRAVTKETARHAAFRYECKFVETSVAINDKVDDLLAGTLKQIRISEQHRQEERRRLTITNDTGDIADGGTDKVIGSSVRKSLSVYNANSKSIFSKFLNVLRRKPSRLPADVENLYTGIR